MDYNEFYINIHLLNIQYKSKCKEYFKIVCTPNRILVITNNY